MEKEHRKEYLRQSMEIVLEYGLAVHVGGIDFTFSLIGRGYFIGIIIIIN